MIKAHKIRLYPNDKQAMYFKKACGVARKAYNWALDEARRLYEEEEARTSGYDLSKRLNAVKAEKYPWMYEVTKHAAERAVFDAYDAFKNWWNPKLKNKAPKHKKKGKAKNSFYLGGNAFKVEGKRIYISKLGWVRAAQELRFGGKLLFATVSKIADQWFISITINTLTPPEVPEVHGIVGVDVGINKLVVTSDGEVFENPRALKKAEKKLRKLHKAVSRKQKGSNNRKKAATKLARQQHKVSCVRKDAIHKATAAIIKSCSTVCVETLNIGGMLKNHRLAKALSDASLYEFLRQLEYKAGWQGVGIIKADRFYPSSKTCSECGAIKEDLTLKDRTYKCSQCGLVIDRDINAALNLKQLAVGYTESLNACRDESTGSSSPGVKLASVKQEGGSHG